MPQETVRTERSTVGNKTVQKTTYSDGTAEEQGALFILAVIAAVCLAPFAVLLWSMDMMVIAIRGMGGHPIVGILFAAVLMAGIILTFILVRPFRYIYLLANAIVIAIIVYYFFEDHGHAANFASIVSAVLFLVALVGGVVGELYLDREALEPANIFLRELYVEWKKPE